MVFGLFLDMPAHPLILVVSASIGLFLDMPAHPLILAVSASIGLFLDMPAHPLNLAVSASIHAAKAKAILEIFILLLVSVSKHRCFAYGLKTPQTQDRMQLSFPM